jgi:hypothetical protein
VAASTVLLGGAILGSVALALGLLPRETRMLERLDAEPSVARVEAPSPFSAA